MENCCRAFSVELRIGRHLPPDGSASVHVEEIRRAGGCLVEMYPGKLDADLAGRHCIKTEMTHLLHGAESFLRS